MSVLLFTSLICDSSVYLASSFSPADRSDGGRDPGLDLLVVLVLAREDPDMAELVGDRLPHPCSLVFMRLAQEEDAGQLDAVSMSRILVSFCLIEGINDRRSPSQWDLGPGTVSASESPVCCKYASSEMSHGWCYQSITKGL